MFHSHQGYNAGHPWYYVLGGKRLSLKDIRADAVLSRCEGCSADDIHTIDQMSEPKRSERLRAFRERVIADLKRDIAGYRRCARILAAHRRAGTDQPTGRACHDFHTNIGLKYCHLYNDFGHLLLLDRLLAKQGDLFAA